MVNMTFRTEIKLQPYVDKLDYGSHILTLGSCFANNLAQRLARSKFNVVNSPTGILFNPASIARHLELMTANAQICPEQLIGLGQRFVDYDFHSSLSAKSREEASSLMNSALKTGYQALANSDLCIITLGTAWVYRLRSTGEVVANCHKQPVSLFSRELLGVDEACSLLERIVELAPRRVVFTLSPVRHIGDGLEDNSLSKSILRVAIDTICRRHPARVSYFPSYEIMMDDLRDYRFYDTDMIHPSQVAVDYIIDKFFDIALSDKAKAMKVKVDRIVRASEHRPYDATSEEYRGFCESQLQLLAQLPEVDLSKEKSYFDNALQINL